MTSKPTRNWKRLQPTSLRHALELCKDHARERLNKSVERIGEDMGVSDHWTLYKWLSTGRLPTNMIRPFETACGIDYVTRWIAASSGRLLVDVATGRNLNHADIAELHEHFAGTVKLLSAFYARPGDPAETLAALTKHMEHMAWHRSNVVQHANPQLEL
ncbi:hypothetical protein [Acidovorax sp.]|uniref:hypothetical protein n=1 Tax=Acidovorax sp. TaxID=1872122 RepID=UPI002ACDF1B7|nr:hypothetical protein [Acidovorax sp.]MDZ7862427.1 hypothetical protein [Acidovorax sp.]